MSHGVRYGIMQADAGETKDVFQEQDLARPAVTHTHRRCGHMHYICLIGGAAMKRGIGLFLGLAVLCAAVLCAHAEEAKTYAGEPYEYVLLEDGSAKITRYMGDAVSLSIPFELDGHPVFALGEDVFPKGLGVTSILIPASVQQIGEGAFRFLDKLAATEVISGNPVYASSQGVLFDKSQRLLHTYPSSREGARYGVPRGIEAVAKSAFYQCKYLESVYLPAGVSYIGGESFYGCRKLTDIRLPDTIRTIGGKAFAGCAGLTYMGIPASVTSIGPGIFIRCENLEDIWVDENNPAYASINGVLVEKETKLLHTFLQKKASTVVRVPGGIKAIGPLAFSDCYGMKEVTVPSSVESVGEEAFAYCYNMTFIRLPGSVTVIGQNAFLDCIRLNMTVLEGSAAHVYAAENKIPFALDGK